MLTALAYRASLMPNFFAQFRLRECPIALESGRYSTGVREVGHRDLMLATSASKPFDRAGWLFELKHDGFRVLAVHAGERTRVLSRRGNDLAHCFPEIVACLRLLPNLVLDGELVVLDEHGKPQFERLRRRALLKKRTSVEHAARVEPAAMFAFDILALRGKDIRKLPLVKRKAALENVLRDSPRIRPVQHIGEMGTRLYSAACGLGLEGIVAKRAEAPYSTRVSVKDRNFLRARAAKTAVITGQVDLVFDNVGSAIAHVRAGRV